MGFRGGLGVWGFGFRGLGLQGFRGLGVEELGVAKLDPKRQTQFIRVATALNRRLEI